MQLVLPRISLLCRLVPGHCQEYEYGLGKWDVPRSPVRKYSIAILHHCTEKTVANTMKLWEDQL